MILETSSKTRAVLLIAHYFPPGTSSGTMRSVKFVKYLPEFGWIPQVLTMNPNAYNPSRIDRSLLDAVDPNVKVHHSAFWAPDRTIARWRKKFQRPTAASNAGNGAASQLSAWRPERKRRWLISDVLDWMHFPDDYAGWWLPGILKGRRVLAVENIDVLYSTAPTPVAHLIARHLKRATGLPWIADFRDPWEALFPESVYIEDENKLKHAVEIAIAEQTVEEADLVIANTELLGEAFRERFPHLPAEKFVTLPNGFDPQDFAGVTPTTREGEKLTLTHAGTFFPGLRTPDEILQTMYELIAEGRLDPRRVVLKLVGCAPLPNTNLECLEFVPRVSHAESLRIMAESDVLLLAQQSEKYRLQIPAKTYEYMAMRKWILAMTPEGSTADLVKRMPNGIVVTPGRKDDLKAAILKFYDMFTHHRLYPVPQDEQLVRSYTRVEQTQVLAGWLEQLLAKRHSERPVNEIVVR